MPLPSLPKGRTPQREEPGDPEDFTHGDVGQMGEAYVGLVENDNLPIPTGLGAGGVGGGYVWDDMSDAGGYAHLLSASSQWLLHLEGKRDREVHGLPRR